MSDNKQCAHPGCSCTSTEDSDYCSTYCEDAADKVEIACSCGHLGCEGIATKIA